MTRNRIRSWLTILLLFAACTRITLPRKQAPVADGAGPVKGTFHRGLWVRAVSIASPDSISRILEIAQKVGITDIYVQVVVAGYSYYNSHLLPRSQYLSETSGSDYDPLDALIRAAHKKSIRIHAWVNALLVWSLKNPPDSTRHIFHTHPEWFIKDINEKSMVKYSYEEWIDSGLEGLYLDPANPEVKEWLKCICGEILDQYAVAGIHLDFIRYPGTFWGLPENDTAAIFAGRAAYNTRWLNLLKYPQSSFLSRWMFWHYWKINTHKEKKIFEIVEAVRSAVQQDTTDTDRLLTAAVFPNPSLARYRFAQNWINWGKILDYPVAMSYTQDTTLFSDLMDYILIHRPDAIFGIGFLWPDMEMNAYSQVVKVIRNQGAGISFFDYTSIDTMVDFERLRRNVAAVRDSILNDTIRPTKIYNVFSDLADADFVKKGKELITQDEHFEFSEYLLSLSLNANQDLSRMDLSRDDFVNKVQEDVFAFKYLDSLLFPLTDALIEPPKREVCYELFYWGEEDTTVLREKAEKTKNLTQHVTVYPSVMNNIARAAFKTEKNERQTFRTNIGIYVFEVQNIYEGGKAVRRNTVEKELLPIYLSWTIKERLEALLDQDRE